MRMKKIFLVLAAALCVATVSAQNQFESSVKQAAQTIASQKWSVGLRLGSGAQVDAECFYAGDKYVEARLGLGWLGGFGADFTALHNWNVCNWDWTPSAGKWFLDAGVGFNLGGGAKTVANVYYNNEYVGWVDGTSVYGGIAGQVKFGIKFNKVPIRLALDYTPVIGISGAYANSKGKKDIRTVNDALKAEGMDGKCRVRDAHFYGLGFANIALSATYCF